MSVTKVRVEIGGHTTVRFFFKRPDANNAAQALARLTDQEHVAVTTTHGFLVRNQVTRKLFDADGAVPDEAAKDIFIV